MRGISAGLRAFHTEITEENQLTTEDTEVISGFLRVLCDPISAPSV